MLKSLLSEATRNILQSAIERELDAAQLYRHIANQLQRIGFFGAAKHFRNESADETEHYQRIADFMNDRGDVAELPSVDAPSVEIASLHDAIGEAFDTEAELGDLYAAWYKQCAADPMTQQFLLQFLEIQRKSVGEYGDLLARLEIAGDNAAALLAIDQELGA